MNFKIINIVIMIYRRRNNWGYCDIEPLLFEDKNKTMKNKTEYNFFNSSKT